MGTINVTAPVPLGLVGATAATRFVGGVASVAPITGSFLVGDFVVAQSGAVIVCTVAGSPGTWVTAGGSITSVFGRTGVVVAASGDYTAAQVTNAADKNSSASQNFNGELVAENGHAGQVSIGDLGPGGVAAIVMGGLQDTTIYRVGAGIPGSAGGWATVPAVSAASALALGTAYQNTLGYDVMLCVYLSVTVNTSGVIKLGVGPTSTPTQQTIVTGVTTIGFLPVPIYLPNQYYALLSISGTITDSLVGQIAMPI